MAEDSDDNHMIQGLWIGPALSAMEQLGIASYLANGHEFHLYIYGYGAVANVPAGVTLKDATDILPASRIFQYSAHKTYAGFANLFRYKLLLEGGGWWSDTDSVCLKRFDFDTPYVFSSELTNGTQMINNGLIRAPRGSELLKWAFEECDSKDPATLVWGETGPALFSRAIKKFNLTKYVQAPETFCPVGYRDWRDITNPDAHIYFGAESYAVHLWHEQWRAAGMDKDTHYHPGFLYERLRRQYLGDNDRISLDRIATILESINKPAGASFDKKTSGS